jgi:hypothetical protein
MACGRRDVKGPRKRKGKEKEKKQLLLRNEKKFQVKFITSWSIV